VSASALGAPAPETIRIHGAREHNLRNLDLDIPRERLVVVTGLSGSGKSSLAFDTLYAEGQRRYVESLSAYARQFLDQLARPDVEEIEGLSPAIAIEQKTVSRSPRSTVGTSTEIADFLRLLYARAGTPECPECGQSIASQTAAEMTDRVLGLGTGARVQVLAPVVRGRRGHYRQQLEGFRRKGYTRARLDGQETELVEGLALARNKAHDIELVVDRVIVKESARSRLEESLQTALDLADGLAGVEVLADEEREPALWSFSRHNSCPDCGLSFPELAPRLFSFNNPAGACPDCGGLGTQPELDPARVVPDASVALEEGAIAPWRGARQRRYYDALVAALADHYGVAPGTPWSRIPRKAQRGILFGAGRPVISLSIRRGRRRRETLEREWDGVLGELRRRAEEEEDGAAFLARYSGPKTCEACQGERLRREARAVRVGPHTLPALCRMSIDELAATLEGVALRGERGAVAERVLSEIRERLRFLLDVGLGYLTLDRGSATLSGGEGQRIRLATQIGSSLMGVLYILDEPSVGLHARDNDRLLGSLCRLRDMGNSVLVVEHDEATIRRADHVIDMGPGAGPQGGDVVAAGPPDALLRDDRSLTGAYLAGRRRIPIPERRAVDPERALVLEGCRGHNLRDVTFRVPLGVLTVLTGVSGSGKSTLLTGTLHRALAARLHGAGAAPEPFDVLRGADAIDKVIDVDQAPIGRTPRSNPATYCGAFDGIRKVFAQVPEARLRGYTPGRFSFNVKGGRCEACRGDGSIRVEMSFLPDVFVPCDVCAGRRYDAETLEIRYRGHSIADVLESPIADALALFDAHDAIRRPLQSLVDVGLGYLHLGQSATTLSGGEAQRVKLSRELARRATGRTLYLLDEPTTGLHFADVEKLIELLQRLVAQGNTVVVIEHHLDVVKCADHVIDLGPEGGGGGGRIVAEGTPEAVAGVAESHTGRALLEVLAG